MVVCASMEHAEDRATSIIVVGVCLVFLGYVILNMATIRGINALDGLSPPSLQTVPQRVGYYDCTQHDGDYDSCVRAQTSGKGCSWYADCRACIIGSHDGKTYEQICGKKKGN